MLREVVDNSESTAGDVVVETSRTWIYTAKIQISKLCSVGFHQGIKDTFKSRTSKRIVEKGYSMLQIIYNVITYENGASPMREHV
jgi:hypothetical protein